MADAKEKCIGKLTLDISQVKKDINEVNDWLKKIGADINLEDKLSKKIGDALKRLVSEAKKAGEETAKALEKSLPSDVNLSVYEKMEQKVLAAENKMRAEADKTVAKMEQRAEKEAAAAERVAEREMAAQAKKEAAYDQMWHKAEMQREREVAAEEARIDREVAKEEAAAARKIELEEKVAQKAAAARAKQEEDYQKVWDKASYEQRVQDINKYSDALKQLYEEQAKLNNDLASGRLVQGSDVYKSRIADIERLREEAKKAGSVLSEDAKRRAEDEDRVTEAVRRCTSSYSALRDAKAKSQADAETEFAKSKIEEAETAYKNLTAAIKNYNTEKRAGNTDRANMWQQEITAQSNVLTNLELEVSTLNIDEATRARILSYIEQGKTAQSGMTSETERSVNAQSQFQSQLQSILTRYISLMAVVRTITNLIKNTIEYVSEYYDKMNEIRIITGKTEAEVEKLGNTYRQIAKEMSVSSLDMADAAIYFTRQGLGAAEIEERLKYTTEYAKAANIEFERSAELITAVVNSMGLEEQELEDGRNAAERVADVFLKIGDSAATSGEEIGTAMQKASAAAGAFGVQFEWLAAAIGAVSETTRQEASSIGTAFNTLIARLHNIRTAGYNSEDETKINDIQKALANINITLLDQDGNWRKMETIFSEIAVQWNDLDDKTKSYIATTMAGVKQQNVFLALMEDMSKATEGASRQQELYNLALDSAGTAQKKYGAYTESITAAQERLTVAAQEFYSLLESSVIKSFYDDMAGIVSWFTGLFTHESDFDKYSAMLSKTEQRIVSLNNVHAQLKGVIEEVGTVVGGRVTTIEDYYDNLSEIGRISPTASKAIDDLKNHVISQSDAFKILNDEIERMISNEEKLSLSQFIRKYSGSPEQQSATAPFEILKTNHGYDENDPSSFISAVKSFYEKRDFKWGDKVAENLWFTIQQAVKDIAGTENPSSHNFGVWEDVGNWVWSEVLGGIDAAAGDEKRILADKMEEMITDAISVAYRGDDQTIKDVLRNYLIDALTFGDGDFSSEDYAKSYEVLRNFATQASRGLENVLSETDIAQTIANKLFGKEAVDDLFQVMGEDFAKDFSEQYQMAIASGLKDADIIDLFKQSGAPLMELDKIGSIIAEQMLNNIKESFGVNTLATIFEDLDTGEVFEDVAEGWSNLDLEQLKVVQSLADAGVGFEAVNAIMLECGSDTDLIKQKLAELAAAWNVNTEAEEEATKSFADYMKEIKSAQGDIEDLDELIKKTKSGEAIKSNDIISLVGSHPEIMALIGDLDALEAKLEELKATRKAMIRDSILNTKEAMAGSQWSGATNEQGAPIETLADYRTYLESIGADTAELDAYVERCAQNMEDITGKATDSIKTLKTEVENSRKELDTLDDAIEQLASGKQLKFEDLLELATAHPEIMGAIGDIHELQAALEGVRDSSLENFGKKIEDLMWGSSSIAKQAAAQNGWAGYVEGQTLKEYKETLEAGDETADSIVGFINAAVEALKNARKELDASTENWLEAQAQQIEQQQQLNYAKSTGFETQINQLQAALGSGDAAGVQAALQIWNQYDSTLKESIRSTYPSLIVAMNNASKAADKETGSTEQLANASKNLQNVLSRSEKYATAKQFKDSYAAIQKLEEGTISATEAYETFDKEVNKVSKAYEDILDVQAKMDYNARAVNKNNQQKIDAADVSNLATLLGMTTDEILADFPAAVDMFNELTGATGELQTALDMLNNAAFIKITGTSDADFSAIQAGLISVENLADEAIQKLLATGQWTTEVINLPQTAAIWNPGENGGGSWSYDTVSAGATVLKPTGRNPFSGQSTVTQKKDASTRKGGGGGGSNKDKNKNFRDSNVTTEVERMLDLMSQVNTIQQSQQNYYQSQQKYYTQTGQLQGTIAYMQKEKEVLEAQNPVLEENIKRIEQYMEAKKAEIATLSTDDEAYKDVADDLDKLQKAHQNYTKQLIDNKTSIDALNKSMDEQRKKIRQMEIDLRNTILKAIEDREKKRTDMLNAEIEMENTILDLIKKRYERERDEIVETTNLKINALKEERDLLDEQLQIRKEQAEAEDKQLKLRELEAKYQRILADPTRRKEAQNIKAEIDELRKEMAWDLAEEEVKAQQDAIDQQITSLEDYVEYVQNYYEELFEHPQKLIAEMKVVISMTHDDMINWMKENDDAYKNSSENTQQQMVEGWNSTYNEMKGILETYWEEVEEIIAQGDDYIIEFLKNNASEYAQAGKLQAEAYVDEWKKQLDDLHKAYQTVTAEVASNYQTIQQYTGSSSGSGSSSGGGGGGGGSGKSANTASTTTDKKEEHGFDAMMNGKPFSGRGVQYATAEEARQRGLHYINQEANNMIKAGMNKDVVERLKYTAVQTMKYYKYGGMNTETGLAWLDGTKQLPERILSPHQTELFETMVEALDRMSRITVSSMPNFGGLQTTGANPVNVGDIIVNVDNLDTEDDYEELAEKVKQILMDEIGRAAVVGGLRIRST